MDGFDTDSLGNIFIRRNDDDDDDDNVNHWADRSSSEDGDGDVGEAPRLMPTLYEILFLLGMLAIVLLCIGYCKIFCCRGRGKSSLEEHEIPNIRDDDEDTVTTLISRNEKIDNVIDDLHLVDDDDIRPSLSLTNSSNKQRAQRKQRKQQQYDDIEVSLGGIKFSQGEF